MVGRVSARSQAKETRRRRGRTKERSANKNPPRSFPGGKEEEQSEPGCCGFRPVASRAFGCVSSHPRGTSCVCTASGKTWNRNTFPITRSQVELERLSLSLTELVVHTWTVRDQGDQSCFAVMGEQWKAAARHRPLGLWVLLTPQSNGIHISGLKSRRSLPSQKFHVSLQMQHQEDSQALLPENSTTFREYCVTQKRGWLWRACNWVTIMHHAWILKDASNCSLSHLHRNLYLSHSSFIFLVHALQ
ncbi:hypothetical protein BHM03_00032919 [Ensete ventricosum]|nr:hypothetical protein BHM03_00032919 [Ensete ventricosum]